MQYTVIIGARETGQEEYEYRHCGGQTAYGPFDRSVAFDFAQEAQAYIDSCPDTDFVYGEPFVILAPVRDTPDSAPSVHDAVDNWRLQPEEN